MRLSLGLELGLRTAEFEVVPWWCGEIERRGYSSGKKEDKGRKEGNVRIRRGRGGASVCESFLLPSLLLIT